MHTRQNQKKLIEHTQKLPSIDVLNKVLEQYKTSNDLIIQFFILRNQSDLLGQCLKARFGNGGGNPAERAYKKGEIDQYERDVIWALVDCYQSIYTLIQMNWECIKNLISEFKDEQELYFEILKEHYDGSFLRCVDGYKFTPTQAKARAKILESMETALIFNQILKFLSDEERKSLGLNIPNKYFQWLPIVLELAKQNSLKNPNLSVYYHDCWFKLKRLANVHDFWCDKHRDLPARAVKWDDGRLFVGTIGGYQSVTKVNQSFGDFCER